jgi:signal transduction histidine kinase
LPGIDPQKEVAAIAALDAVPTILEVVCRTTGMGFAAVARVTEDRWIACALRDEIQFGLKPGGELKVATTICNEIRESGEPVIIDHVAADDAFCGHPTPAMYGFQSYISMPIRRANGDFFGTLCAIDPRPMKLNTPETIGMFKLFAELIGMHLDSHERMAASEAALLSEREASTLREQFIAVLGHDLRNPLASIEAGVRLLGRAAPGQDTTAIAKLIQNSVRRMATLIDNVLDLARGRLGGGLVLNRSTDEPLAPALQQVIEELRLTWPDRAIHSEIAIVGPVHCDTPRVARLLSNLIGNALTHGAADRPVSIHGSTKDGLLELFVTNEGNPIPPAVMGRLFEPFFRGAAQPNHLGLGLGLYIAAQIARAHGGKLDVTSTPAETRFTFRMPVN